MYALWCINENIPNYKIINAMGKLRCLYAWVGVDESL